MKKYKRVSLIVIITILTVFISGNAVQASVSNFEKADAMNVLGLFKGTFSGYELGRPSTRAEAAVMLVRLLGREEYLKGRTFKHPFKDVPDWVDSQVGFMFSQKLTNGMAKDQYRPDYELQAIHYITFVLRSLGYNDLNGDFKYPQALEKALSIGLIDQTEYERLKNSNSFLRDDLVKISYRALSMQIKGYNKSLIEKLIEDDKAVSAAAAGLLGLYEGKLLPDSLERLQHGENGYIVNNQVQLMDVFCLALENQSADIVVDLKGYTGDIDESLIWYIMDRAKLALQMNTGLYNVMFYSYLQYEDSMYTDEKLIKAHIKVEYYFSNEQLKEVEAQANLIILKLINSDMSDYEKVLAIHNYVVNTTEYENIIYDDHIFTAYGALVNKKAVSQGYAEAVNLLLKKAGILSTIVSGEAYSYNNWAGHSWNIVKIEDHYYHLDAAFDDAILQGGEPALRYDYMNVSDADIETDHRWNEGDYPPCTENKFNYYNYNNMIAENMAEFEVMLNSALNSKSKEILLKIKKFDESELYGISKLIFNNKNVEGYRSNINYDMGIVRIYEIEYLIKK